MPETPNTSFTQPKSATRIRLVNPDPRKKRAANIILSFAQNFFHLPTLRQLVDQLIQIANPLRHGVFDFFDTITADQAGNEVRIWVQGRPIEECFKSHLFLDQFLQLFLVKSC